MRDINWQVIFILGFIALAFILVPGLFTDLTRMFADLFKDIAQSASDLSQGLK